MTEFNISNNVFKYNDNLDRIDNFSGMLEWLGENIGPQTEYNGISAPIMCKGVGWEIQTRKRISEPLKGITKKGLNVISWYIVIDDDYQATLFALKWIK